MNAGDSQVPVTGASVVDLNKLALSLKAEGRLAEAKNIYHRSLQLDPDNGGTHIGLALLYDSTDDLSAAATSYAKAVEAMPRFAELRVNLGELLLRMERFDEAENNLKAAVRLKPALLEAHLNLGIAQRKLGRMAEAEVSYRHALSINAEDIESNVNLGHLLCDRNRPDEAIDYYKHAYRLDSDSNIAVLRLVNLLYKTGQIDEAIEMLEASLAQNPGNRDLHSCLMRCLQYRPGTTAKDLRDMATRGWQHRKSDFSAKSPPERSISSDRPLRIGLCARFFCLHPVSFLSLGLVTHAPKHEVEFYLYAYEDKADDYSEQFRRVASGWRECASMNDAELTECIQSDRIDILIDTMGYFSGNRLSLFAAKPAPLQISWLSFCTRGLKAVDYILADRFHIPDGYESGYTEEVLRLPHGYASYDPPHHDIEVTKLPALINNYITFGCFNVLSKINDEVLETWAELMGKIPGSRLILRNRYIDSDYFTSRTKAVFERYGVRAERLVFESRSSQEQVLKRYQDIDIALDTWPYSGGLTTFEAIWMGVPVITMPGETFASRHSLSHLSNLGLSCWVAADRGDYIEKVTTLAADVNELATWREKLRGRLLSSPLCDGERFASDVTGLLKSVWLSRGNGDAGE